MLLAHLISMIKLIECGIGEIASLVVEDRTLRFKYFRGRKNVRTEFLVVKGDA